MPFLAAIPIDADCRARLATILIAVASASALAIALIAEYVFDVVGCTLCLYQRVPYGAVTVVAIIALMVRPSASGQRFVFVTCALLFAIGGAIAIYQFGTQQGWWTEPSVCASALPSADALVDLRSARPARPACSEVDWSFMGLSLAGLNALYSGALALGSLLVMRDIAAPVRR